MAPDVEGTPGGIDAIPDAGEARHPSLAGTLTVHVTATAAFATVLELVHHGRDDERRDRPTGRQPRRVIRLSCTPKSWRFVGNCHEPVLSLHANRPRARGWIGAS